MEKKRSYRMSERARSQEETRRKIVEATMHLHEEIGPRATTISAIAERAGVQRLTVYRHFPDETAVFQACTSHWLDLNPPPDPGKWAEIEDARDRLRAGLDGFYRYYSATRRMWSTAYRDVAEVPALQGPMQEFGAFLGVVGDDLTARFDAQGETSRRIGATVRHALAFTTWADLDTQGLDDGEKADLVLHWVDGVRRGTVA